jgi:hypothetical protein
MRRRWHIPNDFVGDLVAGWLSFGMVAMLIACAIEGPGSLLRFVVLAVWLGPFGFAGAVGLVVGFGCFVVHVWRLRPRRVVEPVVEDLRSTVR